MTGEIAIGIGLGVGVPIFGALSALIGLKARHPNHDSQVPPLTREWQPPQASNFQTAMHNEVHGNSPPKVFPALPSENYN